MQNLVIDRRERIQDLIYLVVALSNINSLAIKYHILLIQSTHNKTEFEEV